MLVCGCGVVCLVVGWWWKRYREGYCWFGIVCCGDRFLEYFLECGWNGFLSCILFVLGCLLFCGVGMELCLWVLYRLLRWICWWFWVCWLFCCYCYRVWCWCNLCGFVGEWCFLYWFLWWLKVLDFLEIYGFLGWFVYIWICVGECGFLGCLRGWGWFFCLVIICFFWYCFWICIFVYWERWNCCFLFILENGLFFIICCCCWGFWWFCRCWLFCLGVFVLVWNCL